MKISTGGIAGLFAALLSITPSGSVLADDLGTGVKSKSASPWHGLYVGAHIGAGFGDAVQSFTSGTTDRYDVSGFNGGGVIGYNFSVGRNLVVGIEGDYSAASIDGSGVSSTTYDCGSGTECSSKINRFGSIRARAGYAFDRLLIYGTGGYAFANIETTLDEMSRSHTRHGWVAGLGAEYAMDPSWSAKLEFLHFDFNSYVWTNDAGGGVDCIGISCSTDAKFNVIRTGLNYRF